MTELIILLIMVLIVALLCAICAAIGFLVGIKVNSRFKQKNAADEPTEEQLRRAEQMKREYRNFLEYNGDEQE